MHRGPSSTSNGSVHTLAVGTRTDCRHPVVAVIVCDGHSLVNFEMGEAEKVDTLIENLMRARISVFGLKASHVPLTGRHYGQGDG